MISAENMGKAFSHVTSDLEMQDSITALGNQAEFGDNRDYAKAFFQTIKKRAQPNHLAIIWIKPQKHCMKKPSAMFFKSCPNSGPTY